MEGKLIRKDLVYPELSYKIIGCAFEVYNELGFGHEEKIYQKAMATSLKNNGLQFKEQLYAPIKFQNVLIQKKFLDFLVEDKVVVEIKKNSRFSKSNIDQVNAYILSSNTKLALLINFAPDGGMHKRLVNIKENAQ